MPVSEAKNTKTFRSLKVTLTLAFVALGTVVLLVASGLDMYGNYRNQQKAATTEQYLIARNAANSVKGFIQEKIQILKGMARLGDLATADRKRQKDVLGKLLGLEPAFRQLVLLDTRRQELADISRLSRSASGKLAARDDKELFSQVSQGKTYIGPVYIDEVTSEPLMIIAVPVTNIFGDFKGVLISEMNLKFMWDLVDQIKVGKSGVAYVIDKKGKLIAFSDIGRVLKGEDMSHLEAISNCLKHGKTPARSGTSITKGINGSRVIATHVHLDVPDWAVYVELPIREAYAPLFVALGLSISVLLLCLVLAVTTSFYLSKIITEPIIRLRDAAKKISSGDLDTQIDFASKDEIGELAINFNQMAHDLKKAREKETLYAQTLEKDVAERTETLKTAVSRLEQTSNDLQQAKSGLEIKMKELQDFCNTAVGRELKMIELEKEIKKLKGQLPEGAS